MAKTVRMQEVAIAELVPYERNAKTHDAAQIEKLKASMQEFGFVSPILIDEEMNVIAGHGRIMAAKELGMKKVPAVFVEGLTDAQRRAYIIADNRLTELGDWDMDAVNIELKQLDDMGFDVEITGFDWSGSKDSSWFENRDKWDGSEQEGNEEYNEFLDKFEAKKTTDDCYTPDNIYDVVADYVATTYGKKREKFVRPFYPGGDYQGFKYPAGSVVVDNPPFSIFAQILDFYLGRGQAFFLFAPSVTSLNSRDGVTSICCFAPITYENGARVNTSFLTNLDPDGLIAKSDPELYARIDEVNDANEKALHQSLPKYDYPVEVITAARLGYLSKYGEELRIKRKDAMYIRELDAMKEAGKGIYGGGLLLSERAAAERAAAERAAAERAAAERAAAERAAATSWPLSEREMALVNSLGGEGDV